MADFPLRRRLMLLAATAVLPLAVMAGLSLIRLRDQQTSQAEQVGLELARSVANAVDGELRIQIAVLEALTRSPLLTRQDYVSFGQLAASVQATRPEWALIVLSDRDGQTIVATPGGPPPGAPAAVDAASHAETVVRRTAVVGQLAQHETLGWVFPVRVPAAQDGVVTFVLTALVRPEAVLHLIERQRLPDDWLISVVDARRTRVARSQAHDAHVGGRLSATAEGLLREGLEEGVGVTYSLEGQRVFTPYSRVDAGGWMVVLGIPTTLVDAAANRALAIYGGGIALSLLLGALGASWVASTVTRPMQQLRAAAESLGRRAPFSVPDSGMVEVRDVGAALSAAADDIARAERERERLLQNEREAREQAEAADRAKDEFLAILSHELRTPLNAVYGWARMLQTGHVRSEAMVARATDAIVRNASGQVRLIDDLLDLSRISTGKMTLALERVEVLPVLQAALDAVAPSAEAKQVHLDTALDPRAGAVQADAERLQQIVWNLLVNAVKFTPAGGRVRLAADRVAGGVRIDVHDTGQGIPEDVLPFVFDRFRQADSSSSRRHGGLGLGLALVKHLVDLHGGSVEARSGGHGLGATFTVVLPAAADPLPAIVADAMGATSAPTPARETLVPLPGVRVLVVDDDRDGLALGEMLLTRAGADVRGCGSAAEALALLVAWRPDVLVSDIEMPGEDGFGLLRRVRALGDDAGGDTPAIALTAYGAAADRQRALAAGFTAYISKPLEPRALTAIVAEHAGRKA